MPAEEPEAPRPAFDERAAVENLERLTRELEASRQRRKDASAAFDRFVSSFRRPGDEARPAPPPAHRTLSPRFDAPVFPPRQARARRRLPHAGLLAGGIVALAAGVLLTRGWRNSPSPPPADGPAVQRAGSPVETPATAELPAPSREQAPHTSEAPAELVAVRRVWVRATVDGQRVIERELAPGTRIPLRGRTIVIRAGDAGAVRMAIDGQDRGPMGPEGIVMTRTYTTPSNPRD